MNNFYNFDVIIDRLNTFSAKWNVDNDIIPMSVADMDIPAPQIMIDELEKFNRLGIYGYTELPADYYKIISDYIFEQYHYSVLSEKIVFCPRIIQAVSIYIRAFTKETDGICILSPSYSPILNTIKLNDRKLYQCPLVYENRKYHIDFNLLEECFKHSKVFVLISPHNPTGTIWNKGVLIKIINLAKKHNVFIISDDVHADFTLTNDSHYLISSLDEWVVNHSMICLSPAKTFNIPGLEIANLIIENKEIREKFIKEMMALGIHNPNYFSMPAIISLYKYCADWVIYLKEYIKNNKKIVKEFFNEYIPLLDITESDGTYLLWINYKKLSINENELAYWINNLSRVKVSLGSEFGKEGDGFFRMNVAMPREKLLEALNRIKNGFCLLNNREI